MVPEENSGQGPRETYLKKPDMKQPALPPRWSLIFTAISGTALTLWMIWQLGMPIPLAWTICALYGAGLGTTVSYFNRRRKP